MKKLQRIFNENIFQLGHHQNYFMYIVTIFKKYKLNKAFLVLTFVSV